MEKTFSPKDTARYLWRDFCFFGKKRWLYLLGWLLSCIKLITSYISPVLYKQMIEYISGERSSALLYQVLLLFAVLILATPLVILGDYLKSSSSAYATGQMRKAFFSHVQSLSLSDISKRRQGEFITRMNSDISSAMIVFESYTIVSLAQFFFYTIVSFVILFMTNWILAVIGVFMSVCVIASAVFFNPRLRKLEGDARRQMDQSASFLMEILGGAMSVRVYLMGNKLTKRFREICQVITKRRITYRSLNGMAEGLKDFLSFATQAIGLAVGVLLAMNGHMEMANVVFVVGIMAIMVEGAQGFILFMNFVQPNLVASKRVFEIMDMKPEETGNPSGEKKTAPRDMPESKESESPASKTPILEIENVTFGYGGDKERKVLNQVSLSARRGEKVALVGGSGGGKTTLFKLLIGLYRPESGMQIVWLNGHLCHIRRTV